jgi:hypothetical protein
MIGENGAWLMNVLLDRNTSADTIQAARKAIQYARFVPTLGWVLEITEMMIPASAGPQAAIKANGASKKMPVFITAFQVKPRPQEITNVVMKKAVT